VKTVVAFALAALTLPAIASAQNAPLPTVVYGEVSLATFDWPEIVADRLGFFTANGVQVEVIRTGSMAAQAQQLTAGSLDIAETSSTQLIEAVQGGAPLVVVAQHVTAAPYFVLGKKGLTSIAQLRGKTIIVGGPNDITRVFMDKILGAAHLKPDDYTYTFAGATDARFAALLNGGVDAAILAPPIATRAAGQGYPILDEASKYFPSFLFDAFTVRPAWAQQHRALVIAFIKGHLQGVRWLVDPANKTRAIQMLSEVTNVSIDDATTSYELFVRKLHAFSPRGVMGDVDFSTVINALAQVGQLAPPLPPASRFYDNSYVNEANAQLRGRR